MISNVNYKSLFSVKNGGPGAKNGFRIEQCWAIVRLFELFSDKGKDFYLLLDNICDVEYGLKNEDVISFDQVKSKEETRSVSFSIRDLLRKDKQGHSIFGEMVGQAANSCSKEITLIFNKPFKPSGQPPTCNPFNFSDLNPQDISKLQKKGAVSKAVLSKINYQYFSIYNSNANNIMMGRTYFFLNSCGLSQPVHPELLLNYLKSSLEDKGAQPPNYDDVAVALAQKGIDRSFMDKALHEYLPDEIKKKEGICRYIDEIGGPVLSSPLIGKIKRRTLQLEGEICQNLLLSNAEDELEKQICSLSVPTPQLIANPSAYLSFSNKTKLDDVDRLSLLFIASYKLQEAN